MNHPKSIRDEIRDRRGVTKRVGNQEVKLGRSIERGNWFQVRSNDYYTNIDKTKS